MRSTRLTSNHLRPSQPLRIARKQDHHIVYDAMAKAARSNSPYQSRLNPTPGDPRVADWESTRRTQAKKERS